MKKCSENSIIGNNEVEEAERRNRGDCNRYSFNYSIIKPLPLLGLPAPEDNVIIDPLDLNAPEEEDIDANTAALPPIDWSGTEALGEEVIRRVREQGSIEEINRELLPGPSFVEEYNRISTESEDVEALDTLLPSNVEQRKYYLQYKKKQVVQMYLSNTLDLKEPIGLQ